MELRAAMGTLGSSDILEVMEHEDGGTDTGKDFKLLPECGGGCRCRCLRGDGKALVRSDADFDTGQLMQTGEERRLIRERTADDV